VFGALYTMLNVMKAKPKVCNNLFVSYHSILEQECL
jgi:hypothetical protein